MNFWMYLIGFFIVYVLFNFFMNKLRYDSLMEKYGDDILVKDIMDRKFWQGGTCEHVRDALGDPLDVDVKVMKSKQRETWKYNQTGKNRYGLRVILENGSVVGWESK